MTRYCLAGATASGKTDVAQRLAEQLGASILSADAMLVYRGMDIGTAKPTLAERGSVPYAGLDCVTPAERFTVAQWLDTQSQLPADAPVIAAGGTGLYFSALLRGLDPAPPANPALRAELESLTLDALRQRLADCGAVIADPDNPRRLIRALEILAAGMELPAGWGKREKPVLHALRWPRDILHRRIALRVDRMYDSGLLNETARLLEAFPTWSDTAQQAIGYAEAIDFLRGRCSLDIAKERTVIRTRQLARRQETYLRGQFDIRWIDAHPGERLDTLVQKTADAWGL